MDKPVYLYYELNNYFQNHRLYVKSRSFEQLRGDDPEDIDLECKGVTEMDDLDGW
jgi:hypothetical protein